jgi:periplasmic divalent cation tolerance protein
MTDKIVLMSTCGSEEEARRVARALVESRAAACVNIVSGATSIYRWKGAVEESAEWLLIIKSKRERFAAVQAELRRVHSYEVPELIALPVVEGLAEYLRWIDEEC